MQPTKKTAPRQIYTKPKPLPFVPTPAPKPGQGLTESEWAEFGRQVFQSRSRERKAYQHVLNERQMQAQLFGEIMSRAGGGALVEPCSQCGLVNCVCQG